MKNIPTLIENRKKNQKKLSKKKVQIFVYLLEILTIWSRFCLVVIKLTIGLVIRKAVLTRRKIAIGFLGLFL